MGDLVPGDQVIGSNGRPTTVVSVHPQGLRQVYRVEFNDKTFVRCDGNHLWNVRKNISESWKTLNTRAIMWSIAESRPGDHRWQTPTLESVNFTAAEQSLLVDPYVLGVFLGDGCGRGNSIHTEREIVARLGWKEWPNSGSSEHSTTAGVPIEIRRALKELGVMGGYSFDKFIPARYMTARPEQRMALLRGILDTDGHACGTSTGVEFSTTSLALRDGVAELVRGLRGRATVSEGRTTCYTDASGRRVPGRESWRISIVFPEDVNPFRTPRKADRYQPPIQRKNPSKIIVDVVDEGVLEEQVCIVVEAPDSLYVTRDYAVTHNSFCAGAGAKALIDSDDIDLVIACTLSKLKENLRRTFVDPAGLDAVVNDGPRSRRERVYAEGGHQVYVMNYEKLWVDAEALSALTMGRRVLIIADEGHRLLSEGAHNKARKALDLLASDCTATVWPMSATVVGGNPLRYRDVFSLGDTPRRNPLGTKADFVDRYADRVREIPIKTKSGQRFSFTAYDWNLNQLQEVRHRVAGRTMAVRKTDPGIREQFKGLEVVPVPVQATPPLRELLDLITAQARVAQRNEEGLAPYYLMSRIACINPGALRHSQSPQAALLAQERPDLLDAAHSAKIEVLNDLLESIREAQDKAVVFCHWTSLGLLPLAEHITVPHVLHYGTGQTAKESQSAQDRFKSDPDITAFCSSDAGTHGLNMQCARYVINTDPTYSFDDLTQRNARIDRADSHLGGLTAYVLLLNDSVEDRVWEVCEQRRQLASAVQGTAEAMSYQVEGRAAREESKNLAWLLFGDDG